MGWKSLFCLLIVGFPSIASSQAWTDLSSGTGNALHSVSFCDSLSGYAGGDNGTIIRTTDGGTSWSSVSGLPFHSIVRKVVTVSPDSAFIMVYDTWYSASYVISTSDAGTTWMPHLTYLPNSRYGLSFVDAHYGVALSNNYFYRTTDGGANWQALPTPYAYLSDISFSDARHGMACGVLGNIYVTSDSGNTWTPSSAGNTNYFSHIRMLDSLHAIMTGQQTVFTTSDGGATWGQIILDGEIYADIAALDPGHIALTSAGTVTWTNDGGASWNTCRGSALQSAAILREGRMIVSASSGKLFRSIYPFVSIPAAMPALPLDGETNIPLADNGAYSTAVSLRWHPYDARDLGGFTFDIEFAADSASLAGGFPSRVTKATKYDTAMSFSFMDSSTVYWRIRPYFSNVPPDSIPWSEVWHFTTPELRKVSLRALQERALADLLKLDTVQAADHDYGVSYRQTSSLWGHWASVTVRCVVPPGTFSPSTPRMFVCDTSVTDSGWHGILVKPPPDGPIAPGFTQVKEGDILTIVGQVGEELCPVPAANSMTVFYPQNISIVRSAPPVRHAIPVVLSSINQGSHPNAPAVSLFSRAEQYEGMYCELHGVTVVATSANDDGSFTVADDSGNTILTADASRWFTLRGHRDSLSAYSLPVIGARLDTLRGVLWTTGNTDVPSNDWGFRIAPVFSGDIVYSSAQNGIIEGIIYNDDNRNRAREPGEEIEPGWKIELGGDSRSMTLTNAGGAFRFEGLNAGAYVVHVTDNQHVPWQVSLPPSRDDSVSIAAHQWSAGNDIGVYYPWDWIDGKVFYDVNEDGVQEPNEPPMVNTRVRLRGPVTDSTLTDSLGRYSFHHTLEGENIVSTFQEPPWEVIPLGTQSGQSVTFYNLGVSQSNVNITVHHIPERVRMKLTVVGEFPSFRQELWWGVRPGATDGIGGADGHASNYDISEGESEIPPRSFAEELGLFDGRFMDPGNVTGYFGYGSWTDMRNFISPTQTNTYRIAVLPGYGSGGNYPIYLVWSHDSVSAHYSGAVTISDERWTVLDMKYSDYMEVTDPTVEYLFVTASHPNLSSRYAIQWNLISLPVAPGSPATKLLFPTAASNAFLYDPSSAYVREDSVAPGSGYWLKFSRGLDTFPHVGTPRLADTLHLSSGWNLIGTLSVPVDARSVVSSPAGIAGSFFGYDGHYVVADTLFPEYGYWVKAKEAGTLILSQSAPVQIAKEHPAYDVAHASILTVTDAGGNEERLYIAPAAHEDEELPPVPPEGVYDVRFATNRRGEQVGDHETKLLGLKISSGEYPVRIGWEINGNEMTAALVLDGKRVPMRGTGSVQVGAGGTKVGLELRGTPDVPREFALEQNYPNPFNPSTVIRYELPVGQDNILSYHVSLRVYNLLGQVVATLVDDVEESGYREARWDGRIAGGGSAPSGVYFYRIEALPQGKGGGNLTAVKKMVLVR